MIQLLLACKPKVNVKNKQGYMAMSYAMQFSDPRNLIMKLFDAGADANVKFKDGKSQHTPLTYFTEKNFIKGIDKAILMGADVDEKNGDGNTALMIASRNRNHKIVQKLIECKGNAKITSLNGQPAIQYALDNHYTTTVVMKLLETGGDVNDHDKRGTSPLLYFASKNCVDGIDKAMMLGANVDQSDTNGDTALIIFGPIFFNMNFFFKDIVLTG